MGTTIPKPVRKKELKDRMKKIGPHRFIGSVIEPIIEKRELVDLYLKKACVIIENIHNSHFAYRDVGKFGKSLISKVEGGRYSNARI